MNESMPVLYAPWNVSINQLVITPGVIVVGYDQPNYSGSCKWWTSKNSSSKGRIEIDTALWRMQSVKAISESAWNILATCIASKSTLTAIKGPLVSSKFPYVDNTRSTEGTDALVDLVSTTIWPTSLQQNTEGSGTTVDTEIRPSMTPYKTSNPNYSRSTVIPLDPSDGSKHLPNPAEPSRTQLSSTSISVWNLCILCGIIVILIGTLIVWKRTSKPKNKNSSTIPAMQLHGLNSIRLAFDDICLQSKLVSGGSGVIWLATFRSKPIAVKILLSDNPDAIQPFINEINMWAKLESPYLITLIGVAWTDPTNLMAVMEYMNMGDLRTHLATTTPSNFCWQDKLTCLCNIAQGLSYLHSSLSLHRDLKSRNVLLDTETGTKLCDFGSSKDDAFGATMTAMVGTFRWMAPEMLLFKKYSYPVDIYSFGVVMCEMETHKLPYDGLVNDAGRFMSEEHIIRMVLHEELRPTFSINCPKWFKDLAMRCMSKESIDRPDITDILKALYSKMN